MQADAGFQSIFQSVWPHAAQQSQQVTLMLNRLTGWRSMIETLDDYFRGLAQMELLYADSARKHLSFLKEPQGNYGKINVAFQNLRTHQESLLVRHTNLAVRLNSEVCVQLSKLRREFCVDVANIIQEIERLENSLRALREETLKRMVNFEKAYWGAEASISSNAIDPWLAEKLLLSKTQQLLVEEQNYQKAMSGFLNELTKIDAFLAENLQNIFEIFGACNAQQERELAAANNMLLTSAKEIQPIVDFQEFLKTTGLQNREIWNREVKPLRYRFQRGHLSSIFRRGVLHRRVGTLTTGWKETYVVITNGAFLHCFETDDLDGQPVASVCLHRAEVETPSTPNHPPQPIFELVTQQQTYRFSSSGRLTFLAKSQQDLENWIIAIKQKLNEQSLKASFIEEINHEGSEDFVILASKKESQEDDIRAFIEPKSIHRGKSSHGEEFELESTGHQFKHSSNGKHSDLTSHDQQDYDDDLEPGSELSGDESFVDIKGD